MSTKNRPAAAEPRPPAGTRLPCVATRQDGQPCQSFALPHDDQRCFRHSTVVSEDRKRGASRLGGYAATATPAELAEFPAPDLVTEAHVRAARALVFMLMLRRLIPSPVGEVLKGLLQHQDEQIHRRRMYGLERDGQAYGRKLMLDLAPAFMALVSTARPPRVIAGTARVLPAAGGSE